VDRQMTLMGALFDETQTMDESLFAVSFSTW
jgi:hypothetical protein